MSQIKLSKDKRQICDTCWLRIGRVINGLVQADFQDQPQVSASVEFKDEISGQVFEMDVILRKVSGGLNECKPSM